MKKILCLLLASAICVSLVACGGKGNTTDDDTTDVSNDTTNGDTTENIDTTDDFGIGKVIDNETEAPVSTGKKVDKNINAVAEALGLTGGEKNFYDKIGAIDGKEYNGGNVVLYQYDEDSEKYQEILNGNGSSRIAAYKDGIVLLFPVGSNAGYELVEAFNELVFND